MIEKKSKFMPIAEAGCFSIMAGAFVGIEWLALLKNPDLATKAGIAGTIISATILSGIKLSAHLRETRGGNRWRNNN